MMDEASTAAPPLRIAAGWWRRPLHYRTGLRHGVLPAAAVGAIVFFVLATYQPFGTYEARIEGKYLLLAGYGLISALLVFAVHAIAPLLLWAIRIGSGWTWTHALVQWTLLLALAAPAQYLYYCWAFGFAPTIAGLRHFAVLTLAIAVVPMAGLVVHAWLRRGPPTALHPPADAIVPPVADAPPAPLLVLVGDNRDDRVEFAAAGLLFAKAADNYCEVAWLDAAGRPQRRLLRTTLNALQQQAGAVAVRVHRSYLVNVANVQHCRGNAQGMTLQLRGVDETVPVSRAYVAAVRERIGQSPR